MKKLAVMALASLSVCAMSQQKMAFNYMVDAHTWTFQPVISYEVGKIKDFVNIKNFDLSLVALTGYDPNAEQGNLGGGVIYPLKIGQNALLNLGGRVVFQDDNKPRLGFIFGVTVNL